MPVDRCNLRNVIDSAWTEAKACTDTKGKPTQQVDEKHKIRSQKWVESIGNLFKKNYAGELYRVFWRGHQANKDLFGTTEFLFDVTVGVISNTKSLQPEPKPLPFISECPWIVESEFDKGNFRQIIIDMNKLLVGLAKNKLFIASHRVAETEKKILNRCEEMAQRCSGNLYFCFVAHPEEWDDNPTEPLLYEWTKHGWKPLVECLTPKDS